MFDKHYIGLDLTGFENNGQLDKVSRITLLVDDENAVTAGDDTGMELVAECPHATQAIANALLSQLKGYQYRMYGADSANIDPAAELGDGATAGGVYSVISSIEDDGSGYMGLAAPGEAEGKDEFPGAGPITKEFNRKLTSVRSSITKTAEQIRLEIKDEINGVNNSIDASLKGIKLEFSKTYLTKTDAASTYQTAQQVKSAIELSEDGIALEYLTKTDAASTYQTATQVQSAITVSEQGIELAYLKKADAASTYQTAQQVKSAIQLGIEGISLDVSNGERSSTIKLMVDGVAISSKTIRFTGDVVFASDLEDGTTTVSGDCITTGEIYADYIHLGGEMTIYRTSTGTRYGGTFGYYQGWTIDDEGNYEATDGVGIQYDSDSGQLNCTSAGVWCGYGRRSGVSAYSSGVTVKGSTIVMDGTVQENSASVTTSDINTKTEIDYDMTAQIAILDKLKPCTYRRTNGKRRHAGLIAQDVETARDEVGVDSNDFAALCINSKGFYGLRYIEFIPAMIAKFQQLDTKLNKLLEELQ